MVTKKSTLKRISTPKRAAPKKGVGSKKAARKAGATKRVGPAMSKAASGKLPATLLLHGDYEQLIRQIYSMSKEQAASTVRKSGVLTPKGKLSAAYK